MPLLKSKKPEGPIICVAVAYDGQTPLPAFEQTSHFFAYYLEDGKKIVKKELLSLTVTKDKGLIGQFRNSMFDCIIARDFSPKARALLKEEGIRLFISDAGTDAALKAFLAGKLERVA